jgi:ribonuclease-3
MRHNNRYGFLNYIFPFKKREEKKFATKKLLKTIKYKFKNENLLYLALTHKSSVGLEDKDGLKSNERLEFLGDAVLNFLVTEHLYNIYPYKTEGQLSKIKSLIVSRKILGEIAQEIKLGEYLFFGYSEKKTGGDQRHSIISNAFEALIGAIYLDGGINKVRNFLSRFIFSRIDKFLNDEDNVNYKSQILELSQKDGLGIPKYKLISERGPEHAKEFTVQIEIGGMILGEGNGSSKKNAEQIAARMALQKYDKNLFQFLKEKK